MHSLQYSGLLAASLLLAGCASENGGATAALMTPVAASTSSAATAGGYVLSAGEQKLDCKQLTGRMQLRILEIRDYNERAQTSAFSRALQSGTERLFGGGKTGIDPGGQYTKDRAMLEAYNKQLAAKGCPTYDLDAELKVKDVKVTPYPVNKPAVGKTQ